MRRIFETSLERLGRMIASQHGLNIVFQGSVPCTDGKTIFLPSCGELSDELMAEMHGFLDHEVAHCLFTDFEAMKRDLLKDNRQQFHQNLFNACEDERIERCIIEEYPGCRVNLKVINDKFGAEVEAKVRAKEIPWPVRLIVAVRAVMAGTEPILDSETKDYFKEVKKLAEKLNDCDDSKGILKITKAITEKIFEKHEEENQENEEGESDEKKEGKGEGKSKGKSKSKGEPQESDEMSNAGDELMEGNEELWEQQETSVDDRMRRLCKQELGDKYPEKPTSYARPELTDDQVRGGDRKHIPYTTRYDEVQNFTGKGNSRNYRTALAEVSKYVNPIRRELERILKVQENRRWRLDRERGGIDTRALARLATDKNFRRPFREQTKTETNNVAVEILIDQSGSMHGDRIEVAKQTAIAIGEALKSLGIEFEVTGWHTKPCRMSERPDPSEARRFNRIGEAMEYTIFKEFGAQSLTGIEKLFTGWENCDPEAVQWAADRLSQRREKRKILMVLSDGQPVTRSADTRVMGDQLRANVKAITKAGMEVVGIGIQSDAVRRFYPDYIVVQSLSELPGKALSKLSRIITRAA